ncbi:MAG: ABC transporter permease [Alphaproteobacteria bacterium]|nr:ABC transporter permease [Alphaproteobacteria bacterium]
MNRDRPAWRLARVVLRRLLQAVPIVLGVLVVNFLILRLAPGDIADVLAGESGVATPGYVAELRTRFGLDRPVWVQLFAYVSNAALLDLGWSFRHARPVAELIAARLVPTLILMAASTTLAVGLGIVLGVLAARRVNRPIDAVISTLALLCYATPLFWIGLMMIVLFAVQLGWLPSGGFETLGTGATGLGRILDIARHALMPAVALALFYLALYTRLTRASMLETLTQDYVRTARAKGLPERLVVFKHALANAVLPTVTMTGVQINSLLGGAVLVETVFAWPGIGRLAYEAVFTRDHNLLLGILFLSSVLVILVNLLVDLLYAVLDPRIEAA